MAQLLKRISLRVAEIYSALHSGEDLDSVSDEPWTAKGVELAIEFYGSRQRPPHGVLSESRLISTSGPADKVLPPGRPDEVGPNGGPWLPPKGWPRQP